VISYKWPDFGAYLLTRERGTAQHSAVKGLLYKICVIARVKRKKKKAIEEGNLKPWGGSMII